MGRILTLFLLFCCAIHAEERQRKVYADIVGDLFHAGHVAFFKQARELGDYLIVGVLSDETVESYKRTPILTLSERLTVIEACRYVDEVIAAPPLGVTEEWLDEHEIDLVVHGDDFNEKMLYDQYGPAIDRGMMRIVPYTKGISTTEIIQRIQAR